MNSAWLVLLKLPRIGQKTVVKIYNEFPDLKMDDLFNPNIIRQIQQSKISKLLAIHLEDEKLINRCIKEVKEEEVNCKNHNIEIIDITSSLYPPLLKTIENPPLVLYCRGNIELLMYNKKIAVVGARKSTEKGDNAAAKISKTFVEMGYAIVSGLAKGIDRAAHVATNISGGKNIAVLPCGIDQNTLYPKENRKLAEHIIENDGLLVSEYPPFERASTDKFIQRNRIQSGLSLGVCAVQASESSGTIHTMKFAKQHGRLLFCPIPSEENSEMMEVYAGIYYAVKHRDAIMLSEKSDYAKIDTLMSQLFTSYSEEKIETEKNKGKINEIQEKSKKNKDDLTLEITMKSILKDLKERCASESISKKQIIDYLDENWNLH